MEPTSAAAADRIVAPASQGELASPGEILISADAAAGAGGTASALMTQLPLLVAIVAIFYFLIIRPQNQERKRHEALLAGLKRDDEVVTQSGIFGKVSAVEEGRVELEISPKVKVWVEKAAIKRLASEPAAATKGT